MPGTAHPRRARLEDVHEAARSMPHVTVEVGGAGNHVYQVGGKSFVQDAWLARASKTRARQWLAEHQLPD